MEAYLHRKYARNAQRLWYNVHTHYLHLQLLLSEGSKKRLIWTSSYTLQVSLKERSFNVLVAPREHFIAMLNPRA
ncbi:MAG: hypothetical protein LUQ38_12465 [Methanotrichaceae archaeon]|nr:hypothetical protein [Methanotrichaceae archaeon]MDD1758125.1 hypothetical protein [Methanotrichaceae archaeon]